MKKILLLGVILLLSSCGKDNDNNNGKWDPNAMISLRAAQSVRAAGHLTPLEIVEKTLEMQWYMPNGEGKTARGFSEPQRDFTNERLLMWGTDIISQNGQYETDFIEGSDMVLIMGTVLERGDTIAYIPNSVLRAAAKIIKPAFEAGDYATCYKTFDEAFIFIPITGAEWRALKDKNEN